MYVYIYIIIYQENQKYIYVLFLPAGILHTMNDCMPPNLLPIPSEQDAERHVDLASATDKNVSV